MKPLLSLFLFAGCLCAQDPFQIHGYVQGRFTDQEGTPDRLEIRRSRLMVSGDPLSDVSFSLQADALKNPFLLDASLTWKPAAFVQVTAGQFKIPFSGESLLADNLETPIERSRAVNSLAPGRDTGVQGRDTGVQLSGALNRASRPLLDYAAGVFRGQTFVNSPAAHFHAAAARVMLHPLSGVTAGVDWYSSFSAPAHSEKRRQEIEGRYAREPLTVLCEQIWARDGTLGRRGGYALGAWRIDKHWEALARADWNTSNTARPNTTSVVYEAGGNYYLGKHVKLQANLGARHDPGGAGFSSVVLAQTQIGF